MHFKVDFVEAKRKVQFWMPPHLADICKIFIFYKVPRPPCSPKGKSENVYIFILKSIVNLHDFY